MRWEIDRGHEVAGLLWKIRWHDAVARMQAGVEGAQVRRALRATDKVNKGAARVGEGSLWEYRKGIRVWLAWR